MPACLQAIQRSSSSRRRQRQPAAAGAGDGAVGARRWVWHCIQLTAADRVTGVPVHGSLSSHGFGFAGRAAAQGTKRGFYTRICSTFSGVGDMQATEARCTDVIGTNTVRPCTDRVGQPHMSRRYRNRPWCRGLRLSSHQPLRGKWLQLPSGSQRSLVHGPCFYMAQPAPWEPGYAVLAVEAHGSPSSH